MSVSGKRNAAAHWGAARSSENIFPREKFLLFLRWGCQNQEKFGLGCRDMKSLPGTALCKASNIYNFIV